MSTTTYYNSQGSTGSRGILSGVVSCTQAVKPRDFASQINLTMENCWGIVRALVDVCMALDDGKYLLVKCAPLLRNLPNSTHFNAHLVINNYQCDSCLYYLFTMCRFLKFESGHVKLIVT